jgi:hypothetical protein
MSDHASEAGETRGVVLAPIVIAMVLTIVNG